MSTNWEENRSLKASQNASTKYLRQTIPPSWNEAKIIILFKKGDPDDIKNYRPTSLLAHSYKLFTRLLQKRMEEVLDRN